MFDKIQKAVEQRASSRGDTRPLLNGMAAKKGVTEQDVDPVQLAIGIEIEMEHTDRRDVATQIALDHLAEYPDYYSALLVMESVLEEEKKAKAQT